MSKEEAIEILSEMRSEYNLFGDEEEATRYHVLSWAIRAMNAEPVRHGRWKRSKFYKNIIFCDECGEPFELSNSLEHWNYCPNCGAKMDEVEDANK